MSKYDDVISGLGLPPLPSHSPDTIAALIWAREVMQKHTTSTYAVADPNGIEELKPVKIGGMDQWLHIRGRNRDNPVLLVVSGGPGVSLLGMDAIQRPWEDYFTVVQWDQRLGGKSHNVGHGEQAELSVNLFVEDGIEVMQYLRDYLEQDKLFVLGWSWGSVIGMHLVDRKPEWIHAYIGTGQLTYMLDSERLLYSRLLEHAKEQNKTGIIAHLETIIPLLDSESPIREQTFIQNCGYVRVELSNLGRETGWRHRSSCEDVNALLALNKLLSPHINITDIVSRITADFLAILKPPHSVFAKDFMDINLPEQIGCSFEVPIFFFSGRYDYQTSVQLSDQWFDCIEAPCKKLIHFEESSHCMPYEEPGKFLVSLVNDVLPMTISDD